MNMRLVSWNIRLGGGRRASAICDALIGHGADVIILCEYRSGPGAALLARMAAAGWPHAATSNPAPRRNGVAVLSREPLIVRPPPGAVPVDRWVEVDLPAYGLALAAVYVPVRGRDVTRKDAYWRAVLEAAATRRHVPFLFVGDWNTGAPVGDAEPEGTSFSCSDHFAAMPKHGFIEAWRLLHPCQRAFSWYSRRGGSDLNGFRIDHGFLSEQLRDRLISCEYSDIERSAGLSDHAALLLELRHELGTWERVVQKSAEGPTRVQADGQGRPNERLQATATTEAFGETAASRFGGRA
jgi:exodeoxyribonuclease III